MSSDSESSVFGEPPYPPVFRATYDGDVDGLHGLPPELVRRVVEYWAHAGYY